MEAKQGNAPSVAMIADYPRDPSSIDGGVQAVTSYLVRAIAETNHVRLHVVSFDASVQDPKRTERQGVNFYLLPRQRFGALTAWRYDRVRLSKCLAVINPSIVHGQGAGSDGFMAVSSGYPSVVTFHGMIKEDARYKSHLIERNRLRLQGLVTERYCAQRAQHTILISPYVKQYFGAELRGVSHLIPNPVDGKFFEVKRHEEAGRILFAGKLNRRKGVTDLIKAFAACPLRCDMRLVLAGSLSDHSYVEHLRHQVAALRLEKHVHFLGLLKESALLEEFGRAAALVLPSYQETAPMVIQQAMAAGLPVLATSICGIPNQIDDGRTGLLFKPGDVAALSASLTQLMADTSLRRLLSDNARAKALVEYPAPLVAEQTLVVYRELIGQAGERTSLGGTG